MHVLLLARRRRTNFRSRPIFRITKKTTKIKINITSSNFNVPCLINSPQLPVARLIESMSWMNKSCSSASEPEDEISQLKAMGKDKWADSFGDMCN